MVVGYFGGGNPAIDGEIKEKAKEILPYTGIDINIKYFGLASGNGDRLG